MLTDYFLVSSKCVLWEHTLDLYILGYLKKKIICRLQLICSAFWEVMSNGCMTFLGFVPEAFLKQLHVCKEDNEEEIRRKEDKILQSNHLFWTLDIYLFFSPNIMNSEWRHIMDKLTCSRNDYCCSPWVFSHSKCKMTRSSLIRAISTTHRHLYTLTHTHTHLSSCKWKSSSFQPLSAVRSDSACLHTCSSPW